MLKDYQKKRVLVFLGYGDKHNERYQLEQSKIAIGSGGVYGKGFLCGTQNQLNFLPESRTDFIFSIIAEETGFIGTLIILCLYCMLFLRILSIIIAVRDPVAQLFGLGLITPLILSALINIYMVTGLAPIVGIPLPFMSYGLSNLWTIMASLGWLNGIAMHRFYLASKL
jgi:rod shape determining protein RodA